MNEDQDQFGEDEYSGGLETQNDADDYADFDQAEGEDLASGDAQEAQDAEAPVTGGEEEYTPPAINLPMMPMVDGADFSADEIENLNEMILNGQGAQAYAWMAQRTQEATRREMQRMFQAQITQATTYSQAEREFPELFRVHGSTIRQMAATVAPEHAGTPAAQFTTLIAPFIAEVQAGADPIRTAKRMAQLITRQTSQRTQDAAEPAAPAPSARVAPAPSRGSGNVPLSSNGRESDVARIARRYNISNEQAQTMLSDSLINKRGR